MARFQRFSGEEMMRGWMKIAIGAAAMLAPVLHSHQVLAQGAPPPATQIVEIPLGTGRTPGVVGQEQWIELPGNRMVRNVVSAAVTPVLPDPAKATGAAVVVVPGGGFMMLAIDNEGFNVARALADRGIAAFVLKYRVDPTPRPVADFAKFSQGRMTNWIGGQPGTGVRIEVPAYALEDGLAALRLVRKRAGEWGVDPRRVGMFGFSAGARTTLAVLKANALDAAPAFVGLAYPPMQQIDLPVRPPLFMIMAADDELNRRAGFGLVDGWAQAGLPYEAHIFQRGRHGFGLGRTGTTSMGWIDSFVHWLDMNNFLKAKS